MPLAVIGNDHLVVLNFLFILSKGYDFVINQEQLLETIRKNHNYYYTDQTKKMVVVNYL